MAEQAADIPVSYSSSSTSPTSSIWESQQIMQIHAPLPSWSPHNGTLLVSATTDPVAFSMVPSSSSRSHLPSGHLWNKTVLNTRAHGSSSEHGGGNGHGKDFLSLLEARKVMPEMLDDFPAAACDYLKGMDSGDYSSMAGSSTYGLDSSGPYTGSSPPLTRHDEVLKSPPVYLGNSTLVQGSVMGFMPSQNHEVQQDGDQQQELGAPTGTFLHHMIPSSGAIHGSSLGYSGSGNERVFHESGEMQVSFDALSSLDAISFSGYRSNKELTHISQYEQHTISVRLEQPKARTSSRSASGAAGDPKKRKSEENLGGNGKKSKQDTSITSPPKAEVPSVKLGERDKIIALQQTISPYGKTDRASVLSETIKHIEYLHEQIQLLSEPYMEHITNKAPFQWGGKEEQKAEHDLRGRGLCLVPVSCTPQVFQGNSLPDCWMPAYKSPLYR
ncbi:uncharacterized protein [Lolium perenne]|uniref:uncharacterized protein isoform X1 n=2 Tax=Lolium perenne TaxID=4522 RepID=UPI0021F60AEA|nr:uncharacterized protein LOC127335905 isoform X1 [Lolium perenne]